MFRRLAGELVALMREAVNAEELEELSARIFGAPLSPMLAALWSHGGFAAAARVDAPARLLGAFRADELTRLLIDRFDEDWFDNPRAGSYLAGLAAGPVFSGDFSDARSVHTIARGFEELLG
jgi:hypothetical protein